MTVIIRARYDGQVFIPEELVNLPSGKVGFLLFVPEQMEKDALMQEAVLQRLLTTGSDAPAIPSELLRREALYEE